MHRGRLFYCPSAATPKTRSPISFKAKQASKLRGRVSSVTRSCHAWVSRRKGNMLDHGEGRYAVGAGGSSSINGMEEGSSCGLSVSCWVYWCLFYRMMCCGASAPILIWGYLLNLPEISMRGAKYYITTIFQFRVVFTKTTLVNETSCSSSHLHKVQLNVTWCWAVLAHLNANRAEKKMFSAAELRILAEEKTFLEGQATKQKD